jgi:hypothetical protein
MTILPLSMLPVYEKDGFLFFRKNKDIDLDDGLIIDVSKIDLIAAYLKNKKFKKIVVNSSYFTVNDLSFLKYLPFVQSISIVDSNHDISLVNDLYELQEISIGDFRGIIDFNNFPNLERLGIDWSNKLKNLENAINLRWLWLNNYKDVSLEKFKNFSKLTYLYLYRSSIISLAGVGGMSSLVELNIDTANKIQTLNGFGENNRNLKILDIYKAPRLTDYNALQYLINLEKLRFTKAGDMKDIDVLRSFKNLKKVILGIKVLNGDMSYLENIPEYKFLNFPHYNLKSK